MSVPRTSTRLLPLGIIPAVLGVAIGCNNPGSSDGRQAPIDVKGETRPATPPPVKK